MHEEERLIKYTRNIDFKKRRNGLLYSKSKTCQLENGLWTNPV